MAGFLGIPLLAKFGGYLGGAQMGLGYTSGAYAGYGISNTWDPFNLQGAEDEPAEPPVGP